MGNRLLPLGRRGVILLGLDGRDLPAAVGGHGVAG